MTTKLIFDRRGTASRTKEGYIEVRIIHQRKAVYISTGVRVYKNEWAAGRIVNRQDADVLNGRVALIYEKVCEEINRCIDNAIKLDADAIKARALNAIDGGGDDPTFMNWYEKQLDLLTLTPGTIKHYKSLGVRLSEFGRIRRWADLTAENIYELDSWLHQRQTKAGRKISDAAVYKYHKCLKAMLNRALVKPLVILPTAFALSTSSRKLNTSEATTKPTTNFGKRSQITPMVGFSSVCLP